MRDELAGRSVRGARCGALAAGRSLRGALAHRRRHLRDRLGVPLHSSQTAAVRAQFRVREAGCRARLGLEATLAHTLYILVSFSFRSFLDTPARPGWITSHTCTTGTHACEHGLAAVAGRMGVEWPQRN